jgi:predicted AAA+ superfamily ATPase
MRDNDFYQSLEISKFEEEEYFMRKNTEKNEVKPNIWGFLGNEEYMPSNNTVEKIPAGMYELQWNRQYSQITLKKQPFKTDELYHLPSFEIQDIIDDIKSFWDRKEKYKEYKFIHKRGILMYGEPGCGKSGIIQLIVNDLIIRDGIVINIKDNEEVERFLDFIPTFRNIEPNRPIIVILEDLDSIAGENSYSTSKLLNILDGVKQIEGVVYIATTNYPERLQERITNRPSRFDRRYKVEQPNDEIRRAYIINKLNDEDKKGVDVEMWVEKTKGMSLSHLKEVIISVIVMCKSFDETIETLQGMKKTPSIKGGGSVGFSR